MDGVVWELLSLNSSMDDKYFIEEQQWSKHQVNLIVEHKIYLNYYNNIFIREDFETKFTFKVYFPKMEARLV